MNATIRILVWYAKGTLELSERFVQPHRYSSYAKEEQPFVILTGKQVRGRPSPSSKVECRFGVHQADPSS